MADANRVDVSKGAQELIHVQFNLEGGHGLFEFGIVAAGAIHGFRYIFEHEVEINLVLLKWGELVKGNNGACVPTLSPLE